MSALTATEIRALEAGAAVEADWDGRDYAALSRGDKSRYCNRFAAAIEEYKRVISKATGEAS